MRIRGRFRFLWLLAVFPMGLLFAKSAMDHREAAEAGRRDQFRSVAEVAHSVVMAQVERARSGVLTEAEAREAARETLRAMRHDGTRYVWILDEGGRLVMHPLQREAEGRMVSEVGGFEGGFLYDRYDESAGRSGQAGFDFSRTSKETGVVQPLTAFIKAVPEWGWLIGASGPRAAPRTSMAWEILSVLWPVVLAAILLLIIFNEAGRRLATALDTLADDIKDIAVGEPVDEIKGCERLDEIGILASAVMFLRNVREEEESLMKEQQDLWRAKFEEAGIDPRIRENDK